MKSNNRTKIFHDLNSAVGSFKSGIIALKEYKENQRDCSQLIQLMEDKLKNIIDVWKVIKSTNND